MKTTSLRLLVPVIILCLVFSIWFVSYKERATDKFEPIDVDRLSIKAASFEQEIITSPYPDWILKIIDEKQLSFQLLDNVLSPQMDAIVLVEHSKDNQPSVKIYEQESTNSINYKATPTMFDFEFPSGFSEQELSVKWSPNGDRFVINFGDLVTKNKVFACMGQYMLVQTDGDYKPHLMMERLGCPVIKWSPDGQFVAIKYPRSRSLRIFDSVGTHLYDVEHPLLSHRDILNPNIHWKDEGLYLQLAPDRYHIVEIKEGRVLDSTEFPLSKPTQAFDFHLTTLDFIEGIWLFKDNRTKSDKIAYEFGYGAQNSALEMKELTIYRAYHDEMISNDWLLRSNSSAWQALDNGIGHVLLFDFDTNLYQVFEHHQLVRWDANRNGFVLFDLENELYFVVGLDNS